MIHKIDQGTQEWLELRCGKATASNFASIMANYGKAFGEPAKKYAQRVALEGITLKPVETFSNDFMARGNELEPFARHQYENIKGEVVFDGGFAEVGNYGASSDGLVGEDGMIEIKSVIYSTHFKNIEKGFDSSYQWQIQGNIWLYERDWCDFVSYCPEFPENKQLHIFRVLRDEEAIDKMKIRLLEFWELVEKNKQIIEGIK